MHACTWYPEDACVKQFCDVKTRRAIRRDVCLSYAGGVQAQKDCVECFQMYIGTMVGIVVADIIVTVLIALAVFLLATKIHNKAKKNQDGNAHKMNSTRAEGTEAVYQELQGPKTDIYSDLSQK
ncbi:TYRO protein tyrosine kinase-binding protein-like isoform X2 [Ambystoma mexicanum]|uniref:TYRO protein tyrosine kinase-binding protein-like isoform X2 n=1 Tax=Ambystoma mexicanum TaxID=8296 RepID=UPI0037E89E7E